MSDYYIGTSGWHYKDWKGLFYPSELQSQHWLRYYCSRFNTVELNNSFYRLPTENAFNLWNNNTPADFKFSMKVSRAITHIKRLKNSDEYLNNLLTRASSLKHKIDVLLYQLPPQMKKDESVLESFLHDLPHEYRNVFEFRHRSWICAPVFSLLEEYNAGFCIYDMPDYTTPLISISGITYIRFHGNRNLYSGMYTGEELKDWSNNIRQLKAESDITYIYFNNDIAAAAVYNAETLKSLLDG
jgi:uncharacterized protein YecE (DUF72 family)